MHSSLRSVRSHYATSRQAKASHFAEIPRRSLIAPLAIEALEQRRLLSTVTVLNLADSGPGSLRQAVLDANANPGADAIGFADGLSGSIVLTGGQLSIAGDLHIDGPGAELLTVSGNDASRIFRINNGVSVSIEGLTIAHGRGVGQGGGIFNAGTLTVSNSVLSDNAVVGVAGATLGAVVDAFGGGIFNAGALAVRSSRFLDNHSVGADGTAGSIGSSALGGAIMSGGSPIVPATATVIQSTFVGNQAVGGAAGTGASRAGIGGAIMNATGSFDVSQSLFRDNQAVGGLENGIPGGFGAGSGGAIGNVARAGNAVLSVSHCTLTDNRAVGGATGTGVVAQDGRGGAIASFLFGGLPQPVTVGATARIDHSTLFANQAIGGAGTIGGSGQGGGIANLLGSAVDVSDSVIFFNRAIGGAGESGDGGSGQGGGIFNGGTSPVGAPSLTLERSLVAHNSAEGATGSGGDTGIGQGGGLYIAPGGLAATDRWTLIFTNDASTSDADVFGIRA